MGRLALLLLLVAACDVVWRVDRLPDVRPIDAPPLCTTDDFAGTRIADHWSTYVNNALFVVSQDDVLRIDLSAAPNSVAGQAGAQYRTSVDLTGGSVEIEVPQVIAAHPNTENYLRVRAGTDSDHSYVIRYGNGAIDFRTRDGTDTVHRMRSYVAATDRWWRISNGPTPDQVSFSTRADASAEWIVETTQPAVVPFNAMQVVLVAGTYSTGSPSPGFATYDNLALCGAH